MNIEPIMSVKNNSPQDVGKRENTYPFVVAFALSFEWNYLRAVVQVAAKEHGLTTVVTEPVPSLVWQIPTFRVVRRHASLKVLWGSGWLLSGWPRDSATTGEERMLMLVSKWTLLDDRGGNRGLEKLKKSCQSGLIEGRLAKLVAVVSVHMRRLKETPRRGRKSGAVTWVHGCHHLAASEWKSTESETYVQSSSCPQKNSVSWPKSSRSSPSWYLHSLSPRRTHVS